MVIIPTTAGFNINLICKRGVAEVMESISQITGSIPTKDKIHFTIQFTTLFALRAVAVILGFVIVPIGLLFRRKVPLVNPVYFIYNKGGNYRKVDHTVHLPKIFNLFDNYEEGCASLYAPYWQLRKGKADSFWSMVHWSCIRNPANNMRLLPMFQCDMESCEHEYKVYANSFYCKSTNVDTGRVYYTFRRRKRYNHKGQNVSSILHIGFKVLESSLTQYIADPSVAKEKHLRYRGFGFQLIPRRGFIKS